MMCKKPCHFMCFFYFCILDQGTYFDIFPTFRMVIELCMRSAALFNVFLSPSVLRQLYGKILSVPDVCLDMEGTCGLNTRSGKCLLVAVNACLPRLGCPSHV